MADFLFRRQVGAGFFGEVWLAEDRAVNELRAVKVIPTVNVIDPNNFYAEAQALNALQHENIVLVKDAGTLAGGNTYIAMEWLENGSVEDRITVGNLSVREAVAFGVDVCWGLEYAHARRYVHRDIKPGNIMISDAGRGKLGDFGLAAKVTPRGVPGLGYTSHRAPEMIVYDEATELTDVYAMGVTLYRMVNGIASNDFGLIHDIEDAIVDGRFPDRSKYKPVVPRGVRQVINKAMNVDPARRFPSAALLRHALEQQRVWCDWVLDVDGDAYCWRGAGRDFLCEVSIEYRRNGDWYVEHRRGRPGGPFRRVTVDCVAFPTQKGATRHAETLINRIAATGH